ncbi:hypothetical protein NDU88_000886 [Pleurodeles waltl]|uniref:Uncharacterized protein n=1 Tax=Pleurodeles waltl TaxID=8319 RepID=A0AAV7V8S4_PLEWA|nr:hypothetical protein NDU88_000886 [Pleurodeles waltl]
MKVSDTPDANPMFPIKCTGEFDDESECDVAYTVKDLKEGYMIDVTDEPLGAISEDTWKESLPNYGVLKLMSEYLVKGWPKERKLFGDLASFYELKNE